MQLLCNTLAAIPFILLLLRGIIPVSFAPITSVSAFSRKSFITGMLLCLVVFWVLLLHKTGAELPKTLPDSRSLWVISLSACFCTIIGFRISPFVSVCYPFIAALAGWKMFTYTGPSWWILHTLSVWLFAPIAAYFLSALLYKLYVISVGRLNKNLIQLSTSLKYLILLSSVFFLFALVFNNGPLIALFISSLEGGIGEFWMAGGIIIVITILLYILISNKLNVRVAHLSEKEFEINFPAAISIILSSAILLSLAAFLPNNFCYPLSASSLILASLMGVGLAQDKQKLEKSIISRKLFADVVASLPAMIMAYSLCVILGENNRENLLVLLISVVLLMVAILFMGMRKYSNSHNVRPDLQREQELFENQRALNALEVQSILVENRQLYHRLEQKRSELINVALKIGEEKAFTDSIIQQLKAIEQTADASKKQELLGMLKAQMSSRQSFSRDLDGFYTQAEILHKDFSIKLAEKFPNLSPTERRLATLLRLGFSTKEISTLMSISPKSAEISRYRLRKRMNLERADNLIQFIQSL